MKVSPLDSSDPNHPYSSGWPFMHIAEEQEMGTEEANLNTYADHPYPFVAELNESQESLPPMTDENAGAQVAATAQDHSDIESRSNMEEVENEAPSIDEPQDSQVDNKPTAEAHFTTSEAKCDENPNADQSKFSEGKDEQQPSNINIYQYQSKDDFAIKISRSPSSCSDQRPQMYQPQLKDDFTVKLSRSPSSISDQRLRTGSPYGEEEESKLSEAYTVDAPNVQYREIPVAKVYKNISNAQRPYVHQTYTETGFPSNQEEAFYNGYHKDSLPYREIPVAKVSKHPSFSRAQRPHRISTETLFVSDQEETGSSETVNVPILSYLDSPPRTRSATFSGYGKNTERIPKRSPSPVYPAPRYTSPSQKPNVVSYHAEAISPLYYQNSGDRPGEYGAIPDRSLDSGLEEDPSQSHHQYGSVYLMSQEDVDYHNRQILNNRRCRHISQSEVSTDSHQSFTAPSSCVLSRQSSLTAVRINPRRLALRRTSSFGQLPTDGNAMVLQLVLPRSTTDSNQMLSGPMVQSRPNQLAVPDHYDSFGSDTINTSSNVYSLPSTNGSMSSLVPRGDDQAFRRFVEEHKLNNNNNNNVQDSSSCPQDPPSTNEEEKRSIFKKYLTIILSCIYATFILMLGLVVYVSDLLQPSVPIAEVFNIYLTVVALVWLTFLFVDIRLYCNSAKKQYSIPEHCDIIANDDVQSSRGKEGEYQIEVPTPPPKKCMTLHYCFLTGRHSGSFYLKIGAAAFCFGHLIHEGLLLSRQIIYFSSEEQYRSRCASAVTLILDIVHPVFSFGQLFIIFKYSHVIINRFCEIARFGLMHVIAANLCFWVNTIIRETVESLQHKMQSHHPSYTEAHTMHQIITPLPQISEMEHNNQEGLQKADAIFALLNHTNEVESDVCVSQTVLSAFTLQAAPYLYPFTIEYSLLVVGIWFVIWQNIGKVEEHCRFKCNRNSDSGSDSQRPTAEDFSTNLVIHVDCHSANRGLFAGLFVLLATVVSVIIFFVAVMNEEYSRTGIIINNVSDIVLLLIMSLSVLFAYRQTSKLDVNLHAVTFLDDILLFVALPCFFLYGIFNVVAGMAVPNAFSIIISILSVMQVILQTPFIIDGLRRCSNSQALRYKKPGREIITFLVVCNLAMWILETFEIKSAEAHYDKIEFYGKFLWTFLSHTTLPLTLFYRFHSSVCLVDIWKSAYEPADSKN